MDDSSWEDYWSVGSADDAAIQSTESALGVVFPADYRAILRNHQGMIPGRRWIDIFDGPRTKFGPLMHVSARREGGQILPKLRRLQQGGYPEGLVPFADSGSQTHFALDYRDRTEHPSVVLVTLELGYDDPDLTVPVADSVSDLLAMLEDEDA